MPELTPEQEMQFIKEGYVIIKNAFDPVNNVTLKKWTDDIWERCEVDKTSPDKWPDKIHLPISESIPFKTLSAKAYKIICDIIGGEERLFNDIEIHNGFIANFSLGHDKPWVEPADATGWHSDGDFFRHFLDSPEQGILIGSYFTDVHHQGGATLISPGSHLEIARFLAEHPEGMLPSFISDNKLKEKCHSFIEAIVDAGDMVIMHPFMLHASSQNKLKTVRLMNNNNIKIKDPLCFHRQDKNYSLVEKAILFALKKDYFDFTITHKRESIIPDRIAMQKAFSDKEEARKNNTN